MLADQRPSAQAPAPPHHRRTRSSVSVLFTPENDEEVGPIARRATRHDNSKRELHVRVLADIFALCLVLFLLMQGNRLHVGPLTIPSTFGRCVRTVLAGLALAAILIPIGARPAHATNIGSTQGCGYEYGSSNETYNCVSMANNKWHAVREYTFGNQWPDLVAATQWALDNQYDPTDLVAYKTTTDNLPDVRLWDWWYGTGKPQGWVDCPADNTGIGYKDSFDPETRWCRGQILRFNATWNDLYNYDTHAERYLACHELGHTVGLRHTSLNSCMRTNVPLSLANENLLSHEIGHLNVWY